MSPRPHQRDVGRRIANSCHFFAVADSPEGGGQYKYFHLLSGVDFPLKGNQAISAFLETHNGKEFIGFTDQHPDFKSKLERYNIIPPHLMRRSSFARLLNKFSKGVQYALGIYQYRDTSKFAKGCSWWSITDELAQAILKQKKPILKRYRFVSCCDEIFMQTFVREHPDFMRRVFTTEGEFEGCQRLIDWNRGKPYEFSPTDVEEMISSGRLFARKIKDIETMRLLAENIQKK